MFFLTVFPAYGNSCNFVSFIESFPVWAYVFSYIIVSFTIIASLPLYCYCCCCCYCYYYNTNTAAAVVVADAAVSIVFIRKLLLLLAYWKLQVKTLSDGRTKPDRNQTKHLKKTTSVAKHFTTNSLQRPPSLVVPYFRTLYCILNCSYAAYVSNQEVRHRSAQPPVTQTIKDRLFGHIVRSDSGEDHTSRALDAGIDDPPKDRGRPRGRPRQTWLSTIAQDVKRQNLRPGAELMIASCDDKSWKQQLTSSGRASDADNDDALCYSYFSSRFYMSTILISTCYCKIIACYCCELLTFDKTHVSAAYIYTRLGLHWYRLPPGSNGLLT